MHASLSLLHHTIHLGPDHPDLLRNDNRLNISFPLRSRSSTSPSAPSPSNNTTSDPSSSESCSTPSRTRRAGAGVQVMMGTEMPGDEELVNELIELVGEVGEVLRGLERLGGVLKRVARLGDGSGTVALVSKVGGITLRTGPFDTRRSGGIDTGRAFASKRPDTR